MIKCKLCFREFEKGEPLPSYLKIAVKKPKNDWAHTICNYCWVEYENSIFYNENTVSENTFNIYCSNEMTMLAKRAAQGKNIYRCEAITYHSNADNIIHSHRCKHFAKQTINGNKICGMHIDALKKGRKIIFSPPSPPRFYFSGRDAEEFANNILKLVPENWISEIIKILLENTKNNNLSQ